LILFGTPATAHFALPPLKYSLALLACERANFISNKGGNKMATNTKKPTHTLRCGNIKATRWQNVSQKGPFFATTFPRPFRDQSGAWRNGTSFGFNDLEALVTVANHFNGEPLVRQGLPKACTW
jgi:hypothetical protein